MVCSPEEVAMLRKKTGPDSLLVVPGIRPAGSETGDQKRIATPAKAIADGASLLVVGRPITRAADPLLAAHSILEEIEQAPDRVAQQGLNQKYIFKKEEIFQTSKTCP